MNSETICAYWDAADTLSQFVSRMSLLSAMSATSALRNSLESSVVTLNAGNRALSGQGHRQPPARSLEKLVDVVQEANDRALFDWKNQVQNVILMQDEAAVWAQWMGERLEAIGHAAALDLPRQDSRPN